MHTGSPSTPSAPTGSVNSAGSSHVADCLSAARTLGSPNGWWDRSAIEDPAVTGNTPRFGTCGVNILRGPGLINVDMGIFRTFQASEHVSVQFRAEAFNISNTPHFANPSASVSSSSFGMVTGVQNTGREGNDQRVFRFGLRIGL